MLIGCVCQKEELMSKKIRQQRKINNAPLRSGRRNAVIAASLVLSLLTVSGVLAQRHGFSFMAAPALVQSPGQLIGFWKFDEGSGTSTADASGNNHTATLQNGPTWTMGRVGMALSFDGVNDYVRMGSASDLVMTNYGTISFWIYPTSTTADGIILNKEGEYEVARFADNTIRWAIANSSPGWTWVDTGYKAWPNEWTHVTLVYDNGTVKTYGNGILVHTYNGSGAVGDVDPSLNEFWVGARQAGGGFFQGRIDEVRYYNKVLTATEVQGLVTIPAPALAKEYIYTGDRLTATEEPSSTSATDYDAVRDFSATQNPNGAWSYLWKPLGVPVTLYLFSNNQFGAGLDTWTHKTANGYPFLIRNSTGVTQTYATYSPAGSTVIHPADMLNLVAGWNCERSMLRWTAPQAGTYKIEGRVTRLDDTSSSFAIEHNMTTGLFYTDVNSLVPGGPFSITTTVAAGDTIDFGVACGSNGNNFNDSTGLKVTITRQ